MCDSWQQFKCASSVTPSGLSSAVGRDWAFLCSLFSFLWMELSIPSLSALDAYAHLFCQRCILPAGCNFFAFLFSATHSKTRDTVVNFGRVHVLHSPFFGVHFKSCQISI